MSRKRWPDIRFRSGRADYFFDLHGSRRPWHFIYHCEDKPRAGEFVEAVAARHPHVTLSHGPTSSTPSPRARRWALYHLSSHGDDQVPPLSFTPEGSYAHGSWEGTPDQTTDWKAFGAALAQAIGNVEGIGEGGDP